MGFSAKQVHALRRNLDHRYVRTRVANGRELSYIGGWYAISEANRIFGFDGWNRETIESRCVLTRENRGTFLAVYIARVRITVSVGGSTVVREGHGTGEGRGPTPGEVHDTALKGAETDATKRALATFGKPFGLSLYEHGKLPSPSKALATASKPVETGRRVSFARDDTTPIPRPSTYYGRQKYLETREQPPHNLLAESEHKSEHNSEQQPLADVSIVPATEDLTPGRIDKSLLTLSEPKRRRDKAHLRYVATQPCLICGRQPCDPHHLRFAQPRALGLKVSDEFTVPLCRGHHRQLHQAGNEAAWWEDLDINALEIAKGLWDQTHGRSTAVSSHGLDIAADGANKAPAKS
jgi:Rad52/22 family double-strand break repair protein